ncbi:hypothetical protein RHGRI_036887 [Rhododendron griersonianum]|uniref:Uncharacterized protein n=1 Tax=Rhododendron griersonianum TaxID=479676 RepID=A0AAV6HQJ3_9ERIC|nr:hypothetical protein RHGRI_036887 [Rhododendron griersonianum]
MKKLDEEAKARMKENAPKKVPLPPSTRSSGFVLEGYETKKQRTSGSRSETISPVEKAFDRGKRDQLHAEIGKKPLLCELFINLRQTILCLDICHRDIIC